jgi:hypothetical protein
MPLHVKNVSTLHFSYLPAIIHILMPLTTKRIMSRVEMRP